MPKDKNTYESGDFINPESSTDNYFSHNDPGDTSEFLMAYSRMNEQESYDGEPSSSYEPYTNYQSSYQSYENQASYQPRSAFMYEEMAQDARNKKRNASIALGILAALLVIALVVIAYFFTKASGQMSDAQLGADAISETISHVSASDDVVVELDKALQNPEQIDQNALSTASQKFENANAQLTQAQTTLNTAKEHYSSMSDQQKNVVNALQKSIDGRKNMLAAAQPLLQNFVVQGSLLEQATELYRQILLGDQQVRDAIDKAKEFANSQESEANKAVEAASKGQKASESSSESTLTAQAIVDLDKEALKTFEGALTMLQSMKESPANINLDAVETYLNKKLEAVNLLIETDQAISDKKVENAIAKVGEYNAKDVEVVDAAGVLPKTPNDLVGLNPGNTSQLVSQYTDARKVAAEADAVIREYQQVGVTSEAKTPAKEIKQSAPATAPVSAPATQNNQINAQEPVSKTA